MRNCSRIADYDAPAYLCDEHWHDWWEGVFDIEDRKVEGDE